MERRQDSLDLLLPSFRAEVEKLLAAMTARGMDPRVFETRRSLERAAALGKAGPGIALSLHCFDAAVDIVSVSRDWHWPEFYVALRDEAEKLCLTSGFRFSKIDADHVQLIPVKLQGTFRALPNAKARDDFGVRFLVGQNLRRITGK